MVSHEVPGVGHPAAHASPALTSTKSITIILEFVEGAINRLLFREAHWISIILFGNSTLKSSSRGEGPAGTATTLILYLPHITSVEVINVLSYWLETATSGIMGSITSSCVSSWQ